MPLRDDLLNPIPGENPSGVSLRYEKVYDQIKEARIEEDDTLPTGAWEHAAKKADLKLVIKLAGDALATKSKDLQLAAWLTEAMVKREGIAQVDPCFKLIRGLQEQFWDTLHPEIEDGDPGMRAAPIEWAANHVADILRQSPITRDGLDFYQYKQSRTVGYEADAADSDAKREARERAINDGKITGEEFDKAFAETPKSFYAMLDASIHIATATIDDLQVYCEGKYGDDGPGFGKLHTSLEEVGQVVGSLLNEKRKLEPDPVEEEPVEEEAEPEAAAESAEEPGAEAAEPASEAPAEKPKARKALSAEPEDWDDAVGRVLACAKFLGKDRAASPVAYLLASGLRFGEMREQGSGASYDFLVSPPTETRQALKRLSAEGNWDELLQTAIAAAGEPCGRAWLDVQRYIWKASSESGAPAVTGAVVANVAALLKDLPEIPTWTLDDDTPTANPETQRWLEETVLPKPPEPVVVEAPAEPEPEPVRVAPEPVSETDEAAPPDAMDLAQDLIRQGKLPQAIQLLMRDAAQQPSGRARFQRRLQVAQLCVGAGQKKVAHPVLEELVNEIEQRKLEEWEASEMLSPPLALLLQCLESDAAAREELFTKLCRIDPTAALDIPQ